MQAVSLFIERLRILKRIPLKSVFTTLQKQVRSTGVFTCQPERWGSFPLPPTVTWAASSSPAPCPCPVTSPQLSAQCRGCCSLGQRDRKQEGSPGWGPAAPGCQEGWPGVGQPPCCILGSGSRNPHRDSAPSLLHPTVLRFASVAKVRTETRWELCLIALATTSSFPRSHGAPAVPVLT